MLACSRCLANTVPLPFPPVKSGPWPLVFSTPAPRDDPSLTSYTTYSFPLLLAGNPANFELRHFTSEHMGLQIQIVRSLKIGTQPSTS